MKKITENDINRLVKKILKEDEEIEMDALRKAIEDYKQKQTPTELNKKTGEPLRTKASVISVYDPTYSHMPFNIRTFYNSFKKSLSIYDIKPSKLTKAEILDVLDKILTLNGFK